MAVCYVYEQFNYGTRMTRMVQIFADLYIKIPFKSASSACHFYY